MAYQPPQPADMQFPLAGLDSSLTANRQPPMTTWDLNNVRAFPPSSDRLGGGSREGSSKLFASAAGSASNLRITGLDVLAESTAITDPGQFSSVPLAETWASVTTANPAKLGPDWMPTLQTTSNPSIMNMHTRAQKVAAGDIQLRIDGTATKAAIMSAFFVDQEAGIEVVIVAPAACTTANGGFGTTDFNCTLVGPILAADNRVTRGVMCGIRASGTNTATVRIWDVVGATSTMLAESASFTFTGSTDLADYRISLTNTNGALSARVRATGVLTGPADLDVTLTATTTEAGLRGGVAMFEGSTVRSRTIKSISLSKLVPPPLLVLNNLNASSPNPTNGDRYFLTTAWAACRASAGAVVATAPGPTAVTYPQSASAASPPHGPFVDDQDDLIKAVNWTDFSVNYDTIQNFAAYLGDASVRHGLLLTGHPTSAANVDAPMPVFRISADKQSALILKGSTSQNRPDIGTCEMRFIAGLPGSVSIVNGTMVNHSVSSGQWTVIPYHQQTGLRITDDGTNIRFYSNGMLIYSFTPASLPGWTTAIGDGLAPHNGVGFTNGHLDGNTSSNSSAFGSVLVVQGETPPSLTASNIKNRLAIYSPASIHIGNTADLTIASVSGVNLRQPRPQSASFNRKFYAVDGERDIIVDPNALTSSPWSDAVTDGTLPADCQLISFFRGAAYLAATNTDPTIWYKSRTLDPLDWDYAADPQVSTAVAGNNGSVGQPADAITAIFGFADDYLVFGMARSVGVLEGDPNYGGQFQIKTRETGIVGPRAFCFDDRGNLYFVGAGGLYLMLRGSFDPSPVGPRKLRRQLEELDLGANFVQMEFRASDRTVRIYLTPTNATTPATCFVLDTRTEGYFSDQIPLAHGPWAIEQINGVLDLDRNLIIGGSDGFIRRPNDDALTDDGLAIPSHVEIPIPDLGSGGLLEYIVQELQFVLAEGGGRITWRWFTAPSPEQVRLQTVGQEQASGVLDGTGFKPAIGLRATGAAHKLRLESTGFAADGTTPNRWALERVTAMLAATTRRR